MNALSPAQRRVLQRMARGETVTHPKHRYGITYVGGYIPVNMNTVHSLKRRGMIRRVIKGYSSKFAVYVITDAGREALVELSGGD